MKRTILIILFSAVALNCSMTKFGIRRIVPIMNESRVTFETETDLEIAETSLASNLKLLEALSIHDPENEELNLFLAEGFATFSLGFIEDKMEEYENKDDEKADYHRKRAINIYNRAKMYASRVVLELMDLENISQIENMKEDEFKSRLDKLDAEDSVKPVFWFAFASGASINLNRDNMDAVGQLAKVEIMMAKVKEWDSNYYFGGPYLFEGIYYGARSKDMGGKPERAKKAFDAAAAVTKKKLLLVPYFYAKPTVFRIKIRNALKKA